MTNKANTKHHVVVTDAHPPRINRPTLINICYQEDTSRVLSCCFSECTQIAHWVTEMNALKFGY